MKAKKIISTLLAVILVFSLTACGSSNNANPTPTPGTGENPGVTDNPESPTQLPTIDTLKLGEDYKDLKADIKVLTHRTDIVDTKFKDYITEFQKLYPSINVQYEAVTDYAQDATIRLTTGNWGDIMMIPTTVDKNELPNLFVPFGDNTALGEKYNFINNFSYEGKVYGIASTGNAQGVVYNKKVFEKAGIKELPKTPDEFLDALKKIKDNTDAIPLYTNFAAGWTMGAWDAYIGGSATGDPDYMNNILVHSKDPFTDRGDQTGPYAVYNTLYEATKRELIEDDPTTTDWEGSKGMINRGEIGTMVLGSWAVVQMQQAGDTPDDIGYMPFPITVNGKQYASAGPDYCFGINVNSTIDNKIASMLYVKWLTEKSNFAYDEGGIPIVIGAEYPAVLDAFSGIELVVDNPAPEGEETLFNDLNTKSEVGLNADNYHVQQVLEGALSGTALNDIIADWNEKWTATQESLGIQIK
jgi:ABC-type glycerol-3-phosphate transport system substrate-binding protein